MKLSFSVDCCTFNKAFFQSFKIFLKLKQDCKQNREKNTNYNESFRSETKTKLSFSLHED